MEKLAPSLRGGLQASRRKTSQTSEGDAMMDKGFMCDKCGKWLLYPEVEDVLVAQAFTCPTRDGGCGTGYSMFMDRATHLGKPKTGGVHYRRAMPKRSGVGQ